MMITEAARSELVNDAPPKPTLMLMLLLVPVPTDRRWISLVLVEIPIDCQGQGDKAGPGTINLRI